MRNKDVRCRGCVLCDIGTGFARTDGRGELDILVVAEALGEDEAKVGRPLVGKEGLTWDRIVSRTYDDVLKRNLKRDDFVHGNTINCRPPADPRGAGRLNPGPDRRCGFTWLAAC